MAPVSALTSSIPRTDDSNVGDVGAAVGAAPAPLVGEGAGVSATPLSGVLAGVGGGTTVGAAVSAAVGDAL